MARILNYGSLNLDYVYQVPHFVQPGETLSSTARQVNCGGKGLNQSIAAAKAGAEVFHAGKIGAEGGMLTEALRAAGVNIDFVRTGSEPTGHAVIQVNESGQNCILLFGGSNQSVTRAEVDEVLAHFEAGDLLLLQNEISELAYIIDRAYERGMKIVLNPSPMEPSLLALPMEKIFLLIFNEVEGEALSGRSDETEILDTLRARFPACRLLLTLGSRGSLYDDGEQRLTQTAFRVKAVDTTAAGDTFTGYFAAALAAGVPAAEGLCIASKASAIAVTRPGAAPSIPDRDEVAAFR